MIICQQFFQWSFLLKDQTNAANKIFTKINSLPGHKCSKPLLETKEENVLV